MSKSVSILLLNCSLKICSLHIVIKITLWGCLFLKFWDLFIFIFVSLYFLSNHMLLSLYSLNIGVNLTYLVWQQMMLFDIKLRSMKHIKFAITWFSRFRRLLLKCKGLVSKIFVLLMILKIWGLVSYNACTFYVMLC